MQLCNLNLIEVLNLIEIQYCMIDIDGPDIEALDEDKTLMLESVNARKNCKKWVPSRSIAF
jgi:hypothetical protein